MAVIVEQNFFYSSNYFCEENYLYDNNQIVFFGAVQNLNIIQNDLYHIDNYESYNRLLQSSVDHQLEKIIKVLKNSNININGILACSSNMSLIESECRYEYAKKMGYYMSGGSADFSNIGWFGMSMNKYQSLAERMGW